MYIVLPSSFKLFASQFMSGATMHVTGVVGDLHGDEFKFSEKGTQLYFGRTSINLMSLQF